MNSERGRQEVDNLERDPRATLIVVDPDDQHRYVEFRCDVESISEVGGLAHRDELDVRYLGPDHRSDPSNDMARG